jgi:membrane-bound lytic murein transglycosylase D
MQLRSLSLNIRIHLIWFISVLFFVLPDAVKANTDSIPADYKSIFQKNLDDLIAQQDWAEASFFTGSFVMNDGTDFETECSKLELFSHIQTNAEAFFWYLNQLPANQKQNLIKRFSYSLPVFEKQLKAAGLPTDLSYFAAALSAMNSKTAGSQKQAGVWQLSHFQGVLNGLQINRLVDERLNTALATQAFVQVIKKNINLFESTEMAVLAYLAGNTKLRNTIDRAGESVSLTELIGQLPPAIAETIAAYQALSVFLRSNQFTPDAKPGHPDVVVVNRELHFQQITQVLHIPQNQLQFLNPQYTYQIIPGDKKPMNVHIPAGKHDEFVLWTDSIYNAYDSSLFELVVQKIEYAPAPSRQYVGEKVKDLEIEGKTKIKYTIISGDVLGFIAEDYDVRVADLKYWNNIYNERRIQAGQKLDIFVDDENADYYRGLQKSLATSTGSNTNQVAQNNLLPVYKIPDPAKKVEHIVKSGESPYVIAKKYIGVSPEAILQWNGISDARKIQIGQKLIIYLAQ